MNQSLKDIIKNSEYIYETYMKGKYIKQKIDYKLWPIRIVNKGYHKETKRKLNLANPKSFNEKIQYMNLYNRHELSTLCADKYGVREYIREKGYDDLLVNLLGVYNNVDEIEFQSLPNKFVLKCTHGSGYNIICKNKSEFNIKDAKKKLKKWMKENYAIKNLELHYQDIQPKIICEQYIEGLDGNLPIDYKVFCFKGEPRFIECCIGRDKNLKIVFYDLGWNKLPYSTKEGIQPVKLKRPTKLEQMINVSRKLSKPFDFVRVDFFESNDKLLFGELTFTPAAGKMTSMTEEADLLWGDLLHLDKVNN